MKLANPDIAVLCQPLLHVAGYSLIPHPATGVSAATVGAQFRHDQVRCLGHQHLRTLVVRRGHQGAAQAGLAQNFDRLFRRHQFPGVVAVMDMGVEQGQVGGGMRGGQACSGDTGQYSRELAPCLGSWQKRMNHRISVPWQHRWRQR